MAIISLMAGDKKVSEEKVEAIPTVTRKKLPIRFDLAQPNSVTWGITEVEKTKELDRLTIEPIKINLEMMNKFLTMVGLSQDQKTSEKNGLIVFGDGDKRSAYFDVYNNKFSYNESIRSRDQINEEDGPRAIDWQKRITGAMELTGAEIRVVSREYKKIVSPRWETTSETEAEATEIRASYYWGEYPMVSFVGEPIRLMVSKSGRLLKMEVELMGEIVTKDKVKIMGIEELKQVGADKVWLWLVEDSEENKKVEEVRVTKVTLNYIYNFEGVVGIYWMGEGSGSMGSKPVRVKIITMAEK